MTTTNRENLVLAELRRSEERLRLALDGTGLGIWDWDITTGQVHFDDAWCRMLGFDPREIEPHVSSWERLVHPDELPRFLVTLDRHLRGETPAYDMEHRLQCKDGSWKWVHGRGRVCERSASGEPLRATGTHQDITKQKLAEEEARQLATTDPLTGLANRRQLAAVFEVVAARAKRKALSEIALMVIDLDFFKEANDAHGHQVGDAILCAVAQRLRAEVRAADVIARTGGDEFVVLLSDTNEQGAEVAAARVCLALLAPHDFGSFSVTCPGSIGVAAAPPFDLAELMAVADRRMYDAKRARRDGVTVTRSRPVAARGRLSR